MDTDSFLYEIEAEDFQKENAKDVETNFDTSRHSKDESRSLSIGKQVMGVMKDERLESIMAEFVAFREKMYAYRKIGG